MGESPVIRLKVYPAEVTLPDGSDRRGVLAILTADGSVFVWEATAAGIVQTFSGRGVLPERLPYLSELRYKPLVLEVAGGLVTLSLGSGCGCGSPLKSYRPWVPEVEGPVVTRQPPSV